MIKIPVYVIMCGDKYENVLNQFLGRFIFDVHIFKSFPNQNEQKNIWHGIVNAIKIITQEDDDFVIICLNKHMFTDVFDERLLIESIKSAGMLGVDLLLGGIGNFKYAVPLSTNLFWIDSFRYSQFIVIYRTIFEDVVSYNFNDNDTVDGVLSELTSRKMVVYPFISEFKGLGCSNFKKADRQARNIEFLYMKSAEKLKMHHNVLLKYSKLENRVSEKL